MPSRKRRRKRARQGEKAGCYTDEDGYKRARNDKTEWKSGRAAGPLQPPESHQTTLALMKEYPCEGELSLLSNAINQRWPLVAESKKASVDRLEGIIQDGAAFDRDVVNAVRCLVSMEKQNQDEVLKSRSQDANLLIRLLEARGKSASVDPEYLDWKRRQLLEQAQRQVSAKPAPETGA